jgi:uncharacterized protein YjbJ (UPF0337 family)
MAISLNKDMTMDENRVAGTGKNPGGKVQEGVGRLTDDVRTEMEGKLNQAAGSAQALYGQARDVAEQGLEAAQDTAKGAAKAVRKHSATFGETVRSNMNARPLITVAVALGVGWFVGRILHR